MHGFTHKHSSHLDTAAVFLLSALFLLMGMGMAILGGSIYQRTASQSSENNVQRVALSYVANQVRSAETVELDTIGDIPALALVSTYGEDAYITYLYCCNGQLREMFVEKGLSLSPALGTPLLPLSGLTFAVADGCLTVTATDYDGVSGSLTLTPRAGIGGTGI